MPELPEVETTRLAIASHLVNNTISKVILRHKQLRLPVSPDIILLEGQRVIRIERRAKYLIMQCTDAYLLIHLGMSGHLRLLSTSLLAGKHDHIDLCFANGQILRYHDPRRFGLCLYLNHHPNTHPLLMHLGPEPLSGAFYADYLFKKCQGRTQAIKALIMNNAIVVGVGNIYATESLFMAGIHPLHPAGTLTYPQIEALTNSIKTILQTAINAGGTSLRDFYRLDGKPGYFFTQLQLYGRKNQQCYQCQSIIQNVRIAGRYSTFCPTCQPAPLHHRLLNKE